MPVITRFWRRRPGAAPYSSARLAILATLLIGVSLGGVAILVRQGQRKAVEDDTRVLLLQTREQFVHALEKRADNLSLFVDALEEAPAMSLFERRALAKSVVAHTEHLVGLGLADRSSFREWLVLPGDGEESIIRSMEQASVEGKRLRGGGSGFAAALLGPSPGRTGLLLFRDLETDTSERLRLVAVFDLPALLRDFFEVSLPPPYPVRLLSGNRELYRSPRWSVEERPDTDRTIEEDEIRYAGSRWVLQMQPARTETARAISWGNLLVAATSLLAAGSSIALVWLLSLSTWILQRLVRRRTAALHRTAAQLREMAITDELTGLHNRRYLLERLESELERARRYGHPLGCLMIDIDSFKQINDHLGHLQGDRVLVEVARRLMERLRQTDIVARFGGDEFIALLPETDQEEAASVAADLRRLEIQGDWDGSIGPVRLTVGSSCLGDRVGADELIGTADRDLYRCKSRRNAALSDHA